MREQIAGGPGAAKAISLALLFKAIGEAGSGYSESAAWNFGIAQALNGALVDVDLAPYGDAGRMLAKWRYESSTGPAAEPPPLSAHTSQEPGLTPPVAIGRTQPDFPLAKRSACDQTVVVVQTVINELGHPELPYVLKSDDPVLSLVSLEALAAWRFKPGMLGGQPVRVKWVLTMTFRCGWSLRRPRGAA
jgi:hypothetical protein